MDKDEEDTCTIIKSEASEAIQYAYFAGAEVSLSGDYLRERD